jgi:predicted NAD/FAD-binding protein
MQRGKIAIIGGGASGLVSAYLLEEKFEISLFEKNERLGGNAITIDKKLENDTVTIVDPGFSMMQTEHYKNVFAMMSILNVNINPVITKGSYSKNMFGLSNLVKSKNVYLNSILDRLKMTILSRKMLQDGAKILSDNDHSISITDFSKIFPWFNGDVIDDIIGPIIVAWGVSLSNTDKRDYSKFPILLILKFFDMMNMNNTVYGDSLNMYTITNGSASYIKILSEKCKNTSIYLNSNIKKIFKLNNKFTVETDNKIYNDFDHLIFTIPPYTITKIFPTLENSVKENLNKMQYSTIDAIIHEDTRSMYIDKSKWSFYYKMLMPIFDNYSSCMWQGCCNGKNDDMFVQYQWSKISDNPKIFKRALDPISFQYPIVSIDFIEARENINMISGIDNIWYTGYYTNGIFLHEDAYISAINTAKKIVPQLSRLDEIENKKIELENNVRKSMCEIVKRKSIDILINYFLVPLVPFLLKYIQL